MGPEGFGAAHDRPEVMGVGEAIHCHQQGRFADVAAAANQAIEIEGFGRSRLQGDALVHGATGELAEARPGDFLDQHPGRFGFAQQLQKLGGEAHLGGAPDAMDRPTAFQGGQGRMAAPDHVVSRGGAKGFGLTRRGVDHHGLIGPRRLKGRALASSPLEGGTPRTRAPEGGAAKGRTAKGAAAGAGPSKAASFRAAGAETPFSGGLAGAKGTRGALTPAGAIGAARSIGATGKRTAAEGAPCPRAGLARGATAIKTSWSRAEVARTSFGWAPSARTTLGPAAFKAGLVEAGGIEARPTGPGDPGARAGRTTTFKTGTLTTTALGPGALEAGAVGPIRPEAIRSGPIRGRPTGSWAA